MVSFNIIIDNNFGKIFNINKPIGWTSNDVIRWFKGRLPKIKIGHAGTLDPFANGILLVCVGKATKQVPFLMDDEKEYIGTLCFGYETDTLDISGKIIKKSRVPEISCKSFVENTLQLLGEIEQVPPRFSALRVNGQRSYDLVRKGQEVTLKKRRVYIHKLEPIKAFHQMIQFRVVCSKGTYIRSLARDIAHAMNTVGYLKTLTRTRNGSFYIKDALYLDQIIESSLF